MIAAIPAPVIAAFIGAVMAGGFSVLTFFLVRRKEEHSRREEAALRYLERQIEELYGPLQGLLHQTKIAHEVATKRLRRPDGTMEWESFSDEEKRLWIYFLHTYFIPVNTEIGKLLRTKSFLLDSVAIPPSVVTFFRHAMQFELVNQLWQATGVDASFITHERFPRDFPPYVEETLASLRNRHTLYLKRLGAAHEQSLPPLSISGTRSDGASKS